MTAMTLQPEAQGPMTEAATAKPTTLAGWKKAKRHTITLPSNTVVEVEIPDLPNMVKAGAIPNELVDVAISAASGRKITRDDIVQQAEFYNKLCAATVKVPEVDESVFANGEIPFEDKEMLVEIATRQRDLDAVGHHLAGLEKSSDFRSFRGILSLDQDVEGS